MPWLLTTSCSIVSKIERAGLDAVASASSTSSIGGDVSMAALQSTRLPTTRVIADTVRRSTRASACARTRARSHRSEHERAKPQQSQNASLFR